MCRTVMNFTQARRIFLLSANPHLQCGRASAKPLSMNVLRMLESTHGNPGHMFSEMATLGLKSAGTNLGQKCGVSGCFRVSPGSGTAWTRD